MKIIYTFLLLFFCNFSAFSQVENVEISRTKEFKESNAATFSQIIKTGNEYYLVKSIERGYGRGADQYINKFDKNLNFISSVKIELEHKKQTYLSLQYIENELYVFSILNDNIQKQHILFAQKIDKNTLEVKKEKNKLASISSEGRNIEEVNIFYAIRSLYMPENTIFRVAISPNRSKIAISYSPNTRKNSRIEKFKLITQVLSTDSFEIIWKEEIELPYFANRYSNKSIIVNDLGNTYSLGEIDKEIGDADSKKEHILLSQSNNGIQLHKYEMPTEKYFTDINMMLNEKQNLICTAFYTNDYKHIVSKFNGEIYDRQHYPTDGTYFLKLNGETGKKQEENLEEFSVEFIVKNKREGATNRLIKKDEKGKDISLRSYYTKQVVVKEDGGVIIVAQYISDKPESKDRKQTLLNNNIPVLNEIFKSPESQIRHYSGDIIVINLSEKGTLLWNEKIFLSQVMSGMSLYYPDGYSLMYQNEKLHFIFNDNSKNITDKEKEDGEIYIYNPNSSSSVYSKDKEHAVILLTMDNKGSYTKEILFTPSNKDKTYLYPSLYFQESENEILLFAIGRKLLQFVKLKFNE